jgi:lipopolysaccharide/colanic/teichoic acid biosynthesis glycosyltransferase
MKDETDSSGKQLSDDIRLTKFGKILRSTSLDELPSLWNIFIGNMSLVGPRPLIMEYLPLYTPEQNRRHEVRPGLTGWAQVNGRNKLTFEERFELDVHYVDNRTFWLDMKIVLMTFRRVLVADGIAPEGKNTGEYFKGTPTE